MKFHPCKKQRVDVYYKKGNAQIHLVVSTFDDKTANCFEDCGGLFFTQLHFKV